MLVHGSSGLASAERITTALFDGEISDLTEADFEQLKLDGLPAIAIEAQSIPLYEALVRSGLAASNKMAREFIENGAVTVNGERIDEASTSLNWEAARYNKYVLLKRGKKLFSLFYKS